MKIQTDIIVDGRKEDRLPLMKLIQREETDCGGQWRVSMNVGTTHVEKVFTDWIYGGKEGAEIAAQDFIQNILRPLTGPKVTFTRG